MDLYLIVGRNSQPLFPYLLTEDEARRRIQESRLNAGLYKVEVPWNYPVEVNRGGKGKNSYPLDKKITTMRVPKDIVASVKAYAEWLAKN